MKNLHILLFAIIVLLQSCSSYLTPNLYTGNSLEKPNSQLLNKRIIKIEPFIDNRNIKSNPHLSFSRKIYNAFPEKYCVNVEKLYRKDLMLLMAKLTGLYFKEFTSLKNFSTANNNYDYRIEITLDEYSNIQNFSKEARKAEIGKAVVVGAFGAIGALTYEAFSKKGQFQSLARVNIKLSEIKVYNSKNKFIFKIDDKILKYNKEMYADADCHCAFLNIDFKFKKLAYQLSLELEEKLIDYEKSKQTK